jgi:hypothetical protein
MLGEMISVAAVVQFSIVFMLSAQWAVAATGWRG